MLRSISTKFFVTVFALLIFVCSVFANEYQSGFDADKKSSYSDFDDYMFALKNKIKNNWTPSEYMEEAHAVVIFKVDRNGNVLSSYISQSSGNNKFDESALNAIENAAPYDEFPPDAKKEVITIQYNFDSSIVKTDKVKQLVAQSERYINSDNDRARQYIDLAIKEIDGDCAAYFLYARRHKIDKLLGDEKAARTDLNEFRRLKILYDTRRINTCKLAAEKDPTAFAFFTLANAYDLAGDYSSALDNIDKAIEMTELNNAYKRYRAEILLRNRD